MDLLDESLLISIFSFLPVSDILLRIALASKEFNRLSSDDRLWSFILYNQFPDFVLKAYKFRLLSGQFSSQQLDTESQALVNVIISRRGNRVGKPSNSEIHSAGRPSDPSGRNTTLNEISGRLTPHHLHDSNSSSSSTGFNNIYNSSNSFFCSSSPPRAIARSVSMIAKITFNSSLNHDRVQSSSIDDYQGGLGTLMTPSPSSPKINNDHSNSNKRIDIEPNYYSYNIHNQNNDFFPSHQHQDLSGPDHFSHEPLDDQITLDSSSQIMSYDAEMVAGENTASSLTLDDGLENEGVKSAPVGLLAAMIAQEDRCIGAARQVIESIDKKKVLSRRSNLNDNHSIDSSDSIDEEFELKEHHKFVTVHDDNNMNQIEATNTNAVGEKSLPTTSLLSKYDRILIDDALEAAETSLQRKIAFMEFISSWNTNSSVEIRNSHNGDKKNELNRTHQPNAYVKRLHEGANRRMRRSQTTGGRVEGAHTSNIHSWGVTSNDEFALAVTQEARRRGFMMGDDELDLQRVRNDNSVFEGVLVDEEGEAVLLDAEFLCRQVYIGDGGGREHNAVPEYLSLKFVFVKELMSELKGFRRLEEKIQLLSSGMSQQLHENNQNDNKHTMDDDFHFNIIGKQVQSDNKSLNIHSNNHRQRRSSLCSTNDTLPPHKQDNIINDKLLINNNDFQTMYCGCKLSSPSSSASKLNVPQMNMNSTSNFIKKDKVNYVDPILCWDALCTYVNNVQTRNQY